MSFAAWGRFVYRHRRPVLVLSLGLLILSVVSLRFAGETRSGGPTSSNLDAARASRLIADQLQARSGPAQPGATFTVLLSSTTLAAGDPEFRTAAGDALAPLRSDRRVRSVVTPYDAPAPVAAALISKDGHAILATVQVADPLTRAQAYEPELRREVRSSTLRTAFTGMLPITKAFNTTLESDLQRAEEISLPASLLLLLLIFGSVVAAALPLSVGVLAILGGVAATGLLARVTDVSQYALNIVTLIGLGVAIDYSLFVVNRFRDELAAGAGREDALAVTMATAGRAITFSGITVAVGLSAMLFYQGTFLASMGMAGALVVFVAVFYGLTFLPALLAVLGPNVGRLSLGRLVPSRARDGNLWRRLAGAVMRRPLTVLLPTVILLVALAIPFGHLRLANGDVDQLPTSVEARTAYDRLLTDFPGQDQNTYQVVVDYGRGGDPATSAHREDVAGLARRLAALPTVTAVQPPVAGTSIVELTVASNQKPSSDGARSLLRQVRAERVSEATVLVTGQTAYDVDVITFIERQTPAAVAFVMVATYLVLFLLTGSLILPLKALAMNLLSVGAAFGVLVFIFQDGHLASQLNFTAQSIDPTVPVILFSIVFGLSMDYEVLLVSRIHEEYLRTGDNRGAVAEGLQRSGRLITGAAAIMVAVFLAFGAAEVVIIKAIGLGLAIAIAIDATVVRALVVPSVMRLLGDLNWWAPRSLRRLYERAGLGELEPADRAREAA